MKTYAVLRKEEESGETFGDRLRHDTLYKFKYDKHDMMFIKLNGKWIEAVSTVFDFMYVQS